jgi:hypothetical protein
VTTFDHDVVVIGSGFGGSTAALRAVLPVGEPIAPVSPAVPAGAPAELRVRAAAG